MPWAWTAGLAARQEPLGVPVLGTGPTAYTFIMAGGLADMAGRWGIGIPVLGVSIEVPASCGGLLWGYKYLGCRLVKWHVGS